MSPPEWNKGKLARLTISGPTEKNSVRLTAFQKTMPWVMIAPLGRPVVPEVYMIVRMVS